MQNDSDSLHADSGATDAPAAEAKRYAHGSVQIAEACIAAIYDGNWQVMQRGIDSNGSPIRLGVPKAAVVERIAATLDAIHASTCEGTKPNA